MWMFCLLWFVYRFYANDSRCLTCDFPHCSCAMFDILWLGNREQSKCSYCSHALEHSKCKKWFWTIHSAGIIRRKSTFVCEMLVAWNCEWISSTSSWWGRIARNLIYNSMSLNGPGANPCFVPYFGHGHFYDPTTTYYPTWSIVLQSLFLRCCWNYNHFLYSKIVMYVY